MIEKTFLFCLIRIFFSAVYGSQLMPFYAFPLFAICISFHWKTFSLIAVVVHLRSADLPRSLASFTGDNPIPILPA